jgi:hypothetical protein
MLENSPNPGPEQSPEVQQDAQSHLLEGAESSQVPRLQLVAEAPFPPHSKRHSTSPPDRSSVPLTEKRPPPPIHEHDEQPLAQKKGPESTKKKKYKRPEHTVIEQNPRSVAKAKSGVGLVAESNKNESPVESQPSVSVESSRILPPVIEEPPVTKVPQQASQLQKERRLQPLESPQGTDVADVSSVQDGPLQGARERAAEETLSQRQRKERKKHRKRAKREQEKSANKETGATEIATFLHSSQVKHDPPPMRKAHSNAHNKSAEQQPNDVALDKENTLRSSHPDIVDLQDGAAHTEPPRDAVVTMYNLIIESSIEKRRRKGAGKQRDKPATYVTFVGSKDKLQLAVWFVACAILLAGERTDSELVKDVDSILFVFEALSQEGKWEELNKEAAWKRFNLNLVRSGRALTPEAQEKAKVDFDWYFERVKLTGGDLVRWHGTHPGGSDSEQGFQRTVLSSTGTQPANPTAKLINSLDVEETAHAAFDEHDAVQGATVKSDLDLSEGEDKPHEGYEAEERVREAWQRERELDQLRRNKEILEDMIRREKARMQMTEAMKQKAIDMQRQKTAKAMEETIKRLEKEAKEREQKNTQNAENAKSKKKAHGGREKK